MELFAGSLDVEAGTFLHAGYISAHPRTFESTGFDRFHKPTKVIDVKKALKLKESDSQSVATAAEPSPQGHLLPPGSMVAVGFSLAVVFLFFVGLISLYYHRMRKMARPGWRPWVLAVVPLLLFTLATPFAMVQYRIYRVNSLSPPWQGVAVKPYADPEAATHAILQGLIVNAIAGTSHLARNMAAIQNEVAFPVPDEEYTPGMTYARRTYGRDGWGREFTFELRPDWACQVASAGPDGVHGTKDDIVALTRRGGVDWEDRLSGVFVRPVTGKLENHLCFIHRVENPLFLTAHGEEASKLTGNEIFDMIPLDDVFRPLGEGPSPNLTALKAQLRRQPRASDPEPLYFVQFGDRYNE
jgi:hypothetical protein